MSPMKAFTRDASIVRNSFKPGNELEFQAA
jgi:hypothetical protein